MKDYVDKVRAITKTIGNNKVWDYRTKIDKIQRFYTTNETNYMIGLISFSEYEQVNDYINEMYIFLATKD